jgi:hypothetical protein
MKFQVHVHNWPSTILVVLLFGHISIASKLFLIPGGPIAVCCLFRDTGKVCILCHFTGMLSVRFFSICRACNRTIRLFIGYGTVGIESQFSIC